MIVELPSDEILRSADVIELFDPHHPELHDVLVDNAPQIPIPRDDLFVINIPVDFHDAARIDSWKHRVAEARQE